MAGIARIVGAKQLEQALLSAFEEWTREDVNERYWREKFEDKYRYPGPPTLRKNGEIARDPRDILDTESLYESGVESYKFTRGATGAEANWHWDAKNSSGEEYAWFVHEGQGPYSRAPRRWTDELASEYLFETSEIKRDLMDALDRHLNA
jgi:hypothetical protein